MADKDVVKVIATNRETILEVWRSFLDKHGIKYDMLKNLEDCC